MFVWELHDNTRSLKGSFLVAWLETQSSACSHVLLLLQGLKYSFQTHDRLCFVMEYANGGEVSHFKTSQMSTFYIYINQWCLTFNDRCKVSPFFFWTKSHLSFICWQPPAFLPSVKRPCVLRRASSVLRCRDSVGAGLPARWEKCGLSRLKGRQGNECSPSPFAASLLFSAFSIFPSFLPPPPGYK